MHSAVTNPATLLPSPTPESALLRELETPGLTNLQEHSSPHIQDQCWSPNSPSPIEEPVNALQVLKAENEALAQKVFEPVED